MYRFESRVRFSEVDESGRLPISSIVNYFQDCSTFQSEDLGVGVEYLHTMQLVWVVNSWQIIVDRYPSLGEHITIGTAPHILRNFMGERNFYMLDESGTMIAKANSIWTLLSTENNHPTRIPDFIMEKYTLKEAIPMEYAPRKIALPKEGGELQESFLVHAGHLDTNHHVNNGQYINMALAYMNVQGDVKQLRAEYCNQARLGDLITPKRYEVDGQSIVALNDENGKPYAVVSLQQ